MTMNGDISFIENKINLAVFQKICFKLFGGRFEYYPNKIVNHKPKCNNTMYNMIEINSQLQNPSYLE